MQKGAPEFSMRGIGERNHIAFTKLLHLSGILSYRSSEVRVSFQRLERSNFLALDDLALLTVHIRRLAVQGRQVSIKWPRRTHGGLPTRMQKLLLGLRFAGLFAKSDRHNWTQSVTLDGSVSSPRESRTFAPDAARAHFLPMMWLDASSFGVDLDSCGDIWSARPHLPSLVNSNMRSLLHAQGFLDTDAVDALLHVIFMELGWNAVLHSEAEPGTGFAIFCGQVEHPSKQNRLTNPKLTFCFVDSGRGIPNALRSQYEIAAVRSEQDYSRELECSQEAAIVRFALDRDSTSRPHHASTNDAEGCRGLAYVTRSLEGRGQLRIRSDGGAVTIRADVSGTSVTPERFPDDYRAIPGTQVIGEIHSKRSKAIFGTGASETNSLVEIQDNHVIDLSTLLENEPSLSELADFISREKKFAESLLILDLGCRELTPRIVENLCKLVANQMGVAVCILWNARIDWSVLRGFSDWLTEECKKRKLPVFALVKQHDEIFIPGVNKNNQDNTAEKLCDHAPWLAINSSHPAHLPNSRNGELRLPDWFAISRTLNSYRLENGFATENTDLGCYVGAIHLLNGEKVKRYFSFAKNVDQHPGNFQTWLRSVVASLEMLPTRPDKPLTIIGFAITVRNLVQEVLSYSESGVRGFTILSYDLPSIEELRTVIDEPCDVVLLTDVLSTGSTASGLIEQLNKLEATTVAVVSTVDARIEDTFQRDKILIGDLAYPVISCARIDIRPNSERAALPLDVEYWIDPVSMIPQEKRSELWDLPQNVLTRIEATLQAVEDTNAVKIGHCVDGVRHMSTFIDVRALIETSGVAVFEYVRSEIEQRLKDREWNDFDPSHIVAPSGVSRIEPASIHRVANVTVYGTAAGIYTTFIRDNMWPNAKEVSVLRSFDPGGNSRCAHVIGDLKEPKHGLKDVVIADDGMWTGRTISSLLRGVVEAGARRVLIVPLLSRLRATESVHWESLTSVFSQTHRRETPTCFFFPFLFPVPAYNHQDCPFVITSERIEKRAGELQVLRDIADRRKHELEAKTPREIPFLDSSQGGFIARLRCFLELASEHEFALESVRSMLEEQLENFDNERCHRILDTFLLEWPLLDRARIRHALSPLVLRLAIAAVSSDKAGPQVKKSAASILRSRFPNDFVAHLPSLVQLSRENIAVLEQSVFHIATLGRQYRNHAGVSRFLKGVSEIRREDVAACDGEDILRFMDVLPVVGQLLLESDAEVSPALQDETLQECLENLLQLVAEDGIFQHELRPFLETHDIGRDNLREVTQGTWKGYWDRWSNTLYPLLAKSVVPRIKRASKVIRRTLTPPQSLTNGETEYLCGSGLRESKNLESDIAAIHTGLRMQASGNAFNGTVDLSGDACRRVWSAICGSRSAIQAALSDGKKIEEQNRLATLSRALLKLRKYRVVDLARRFRLEIENCIGSAGKIGEVSLFGPDETYANQWAFVPTDIVDHAIAHIVLNLRDHAWPVESAKEVSVQITCARSTSPADGRVDLSIRNTGVPIKEEISQGTDGRLLNSTMRIFDGAFPPPARSTVIGFETEQSFRVKLWSASINESLTS